MRNIKENNGITLIALVVTIIVLLILAAVTIGLVLGQNGIIGKANKAKSATDIASGKDQVQLALAKVVSDKLEDGKTTSDIKAEDLQTELQKTDSSASVTGSNPNFTAKYHVNGTEYEYGINTGTQTITAKEVSSSTSDDTDESYFIWGNEVIEIGENDKFIGYISIYNSVVDGYDLTQIYQELGIEPFYSNGYYCYQLGEDNYRDFTDQYTAEEIKLFYEKVQEYINSTIVGYKLEVNGLSKLVIPSRCKRIECIYMVSDGTTREELSGGIQIVELPNTIKEIGGYAFNDFKDLKSLNIPSSVTSITNSAFKGCVALTNIDIPNSVTNIGWYAFENCTNIKNISIPNSVATIGEGAFQGCNALQSMDIPNSVNVIDSNAFKGCTSLQNVNMPNGVTNINWNAFEDCNSLTSINIPNSVTRIEMEAFKGCSNLQNISLPDSLTYIGVYAFADCTSLTTVYTNNQTVIDYMNSNYPNITIKPYEELPNL